MLDAAQASESERTAYQVAVTGHRVLGSTEQQGRLAEQLRVFFQRLKAEQRLEVVALSGMAAGADLLFAEVALEQELPLEAVLAHQQITATFAADNERAHYQRLMHQCRCIHQLPFRYATTGAYMALGYWLVDHCDVLLALWDGQPAAGLGGTGDVVAYARVVGRLVHHIEVVRG